YTLWVRPTRRVSRATASSTSAGLPRICSSNTTIVSATRTPAIPSRETRAATAASLSPTTRSRYSVGGSLARTCSATSAGSTWNGMRRLSRMSRRRGDAEPSTSGVRALIMGGACKSPEPASTKPRSGGLRRFRRRGCGWLVALASATAPGVAHADCQPSAASPCIDANALWLRPGAHDFVAVPAGEPIPAGAVALGMGAMLLLRPLVLTAPSPDPRGREVPLVQHAVDQHLRVAAGLGHGFELGAALATVLWQRGAGPSAITTQRGG